MEYQKCMGTVSFPADVSGLHIWTVSPLPPEASLQPRAWEVRWNSDTSEDREGDAGGQRPARGENQIEIKLAHHRTLKGTDIEMSEEMVM